MPQRDLRVVGDVDRPSLEVRQLWRKLPAGPRIASRLGQAGSLHHKVAGLHCPDQPPRENPHHRVVEVPLPPRLRRPRPRKQPVQPLLLSRQHLRQILQLRLHLLQPVGVVRLHRRRHGLLRLAVGFAPSGRRLAGRVDARLGREVPERLDPLPDAGQPQRRHAHLLHVLRRDAHRGRLRLERLADESLGGAELHLRLQVSQLRQRRLRRHLPDRPNCRVADLHRPRPDAGELLVGGDRERADGPSGLCRIEVRSQPAEAFEGDFTGVAEQVRMCGVATFRPILVLLVRVAWHVGKGEPLGHTIYERTDDRSKLLRLRGPRLRRLAAFRQHRVVHQLGPRVVCVHDRLRRLAPHVRGRQEALRPRTGDRVQPLRLRPGRPLADQRRDGLT